MGGPHVPERELGYYLGLSDESRFAMERSMLVDFL